MVSFSESEMEKSISKAKHCRSIFRHLLLILLVLQVYSSKQLLAVSQSSTIKYLPGFEGPLPFHLETGYVGVDHSEDVQLFYYFVKSETNPIEDPLILWLTGGPGCSSLTALLYEIGPLNFEVVEYDGSLPKLVLNPNSWTKVSSIIFLDLPVDTGFSYTRNPHISDRSDFQSIFHARQFLRKWMDDHPEFRSNPLYLGGDSYSGTPLPVIVQQISNENEEGIEPFINLKGYLLGNPITDQHLEENFQIPFAHGMALISDELYQSLMKSCGGEYKLIDPRNTLCLKHVQAYQECISGIQYVHILEPDCPLASPKPQEMMMMIHKSRYLNQNSPELLDPQSSLPSFGCRSYAYLLSNFWANDEDVRDALHIQKGSVRKWQRCTTFSLPYIYQIKSTTPYHLNLSNKGYRSLIYSGDHDFLVPFLSTQAWISSLNYTIVDEWRSWKVRGQVAGYTRTYSNQMTFATVKGGGHTAPEYKPEECWTMFKRWISHQPL